MVEVPVHCRSGRQEVQCLNRLSAEVPVLVPLGMSQLGSPLGLGVGVEGGCPVQLGWQWELA